MNCSEFCQNLSLYVDDALTPEVRAVCNEHLQSCPLCRTDLAETRTVTFFLRQNSQPSAPPNLAASIKNVVAIELAAQKQIQQTTSVKIPFWQTVWRHLQPKLIPYTAGALASVLFFVMMFGSLISSIASFQQLEARASRERQARQVLLAASTQMPYESLPSLPAADYAVRRLSIASESPSLDPQSTFVALTASLTRGEMDEEGIMVVADVLSSGVARITEVVEPPREPQKLAELEKLMVEDPAFVPATLDRRPENVRVVFLIQKVDVGVVENVEVNTKQQAVKNAKARRL